MIPLMLLFPAPFVRAAMGVPAASTAGKTAAEEALEAAPSESERAAVSIMGNDDEPV